MPAFVYPLAYVEVIPLCEDQTCWTSASLKRQLIQLSVRGPPLKIKWDTSSVGRLFTEKESLGNEPLLYLRQASPSADLVACRCNAYLLEQQPCEEIVVHVTESTLVHVRRESSWKLQLTGEVGGKESLQDALSCYNPETVRQLTCYLNMAFSEVTYLGTTEDAFVRKDKSVRRKQIMDQNLGRLLGQPVRSETRKDSFSAHKFIIVHSPDHGDGKTTLVTTLLRQLGCSDVHLIRPGPLLAKFGVMADAALATIVHEVASSAAFRQRKVAIVIDHLDVFWGTATDAAAPALSGCAAYLKRLSHSLQQRSEILFPSGTRLYNWRGREGHVVPVSFCLVGITTCADDALVVLGSISTPRFRLPALSADTRLKAFQYAFEKVELQLTKSLQQRLPHLAAGAVRAKGTDFSRVAQRIAFSLAKSGDTEVTVELFQDCLRAVVSSSASSEVLFVSQRGGDIFSSVGGNEFAKRAIEEALMCDPNQRAILYSVGLKPPSGILLYGPPGTGKTLLAKAIANFLSDASGSSALGGAFISLTSTDIVRSEFGTGEKMLTAAFETAKLNAPSVIFLDEFQALFTERGSSSSRLTSTLMVCMDNIATWRSLRKNNGLDVQNEQEHVVLLAATNSPWQIDKAFLRPGRFDRCIHVGLPDQPSRRDIYILHVGQMKTNLTGSLDDLCNELGRLSQGFSGADIAAHCHAAAVLCLVDGSDSVTEHHFHNALENGFQASSDDALVTRLSEWVPT